MACEFIEHPDRIPGGRVATVGAWVVEHCFGPLGVGTMVVKPVRHVTHLAHLNATETAELGPLLSRVAEAVAGERSEAGEPPGQVYACLWSHADREPGHIHFVVQPVGPSLMERFDAHGPELQVRMFRANEPMDPAAVEAAADGVRRRLAAAIAPNAERAGP